VGLERAAFLYVGDIEQAVLDLHKSESDVKKAKASASVGEDDDTDDGGADDGSLPNLKRKGRNSHPPIQELLEVGQHIVVQIAKDPIGTKGARLTTNLALPGRYLVYMPTVAHVGISRRIDRDKERRRLRQLVDAHRPDGAGFIVRTVCEGRPTETLVQDMRYLTRTWDKILAKAKEAKAPALLHSEQGLVQRAVRDLADDEVRRIVVDRRDLFDEVRGFMTELIPELADKVQLYKGVEPVFDVYGVEGALQRSLGRKVWLKSGGYLVIDQSEALMAIDVNSGRFVGSSSLEDTTLQTNLEAVEEVVHQLRLRNMGGIIIIDLIDMEKEANRTKVHKALEDALHLAGEGDAGLQAHVHLVGQGGGPRVAARAARVAGHHHEVAVVHARGVHREVVGGLVGHVVFGEIGRGPVGGHVGAEEGEVGAMTGPHPVVGIVAELAHVAGGRVHHAQVADLAAGDEAVAAAAVEAGHPAAQGVVGLARRQQGAAVALQAVLALGVFGALADALHHLAGDVGDVGDDPQAACGPHGGFFFQGGGAEAVGVAVHRLGGDVAEEVFHAVVVRRQQAVFGDEGRRAETQAGDGAQGGLHGIGEHLGGDLKALLHERGGGLGELLGEPHALGGEGLGEEEPDHERISRRVARRGL